MPTRRTPRRSAKSSGRRGRSPAPRASTSSRRRRVAQSPAPSEGTITDDSEPDTDGSELLTPASAAGTSTTTTTTTTTTVTRSRSSRRSTATSPAPPSRAARAKQFADEDEGWLFGGPTGTAAIMIGSHVIVLYLYCCNIANQGHLLASGDVIGMFKYAAAHGDLCTAAIVYTTFVVAQGLLYKWGPGIEVLGRPLRHEGGKRLVYNCNGVFAFAFSNVVLLYLHYYGYIRLGWVIDNLGALVVVSMLAGDLVTLGVYVAAIATGNATRMTGSHSYDIFMGAWLNPRISDIDLKLLAETRLAWMGVFYVTVGAAAKQYELYGAVSPSMWFMLTAHFLYTNACMKGEECVPTTWDIFFEKWGFMLIFWNLCGVPLAYSFQSVYILQQGTRELLPFPAVVALFVWLLGCYYVWDTANSQKNRMRMKEEGSYQPRPWALPQLPWGTLENPKVLVTKQGSKLLIDGWWRYSRKIHYLADIGMALSWGLCCGFDAFLPYFYVCFFAGFLSTRVNRDNTRCRKKYGKDWDKYCTIVPYKLIPGLW